METSPRSLNLLQVKELLVKTLTNLIAKRDHLNELDRVLGDGDHGSTMARGAQSAIDALEAGNFSSVNQIFGAVGRAMMTSMGGASGMLFGLFFRSAERAPMTDVLDTAALSAMFDRGLEELRVRTKAQPGDKTMLDALLPALAALRANKESFASALDQAAGAAELGAQSTADLPAKFGRARTLGERARGAPDPGATSTALFFSGLATNARLLSQLDEVGVDRRMETGTKQMKPIAIGADDAAVDLKAQIVKHLESKGIPVHDYGVFSADPMLYPDIALEVAQAVADGKHERGILMCGTGIGVCITANKVPGIRAAVCHDLYSAERSRMSNDCQIMTLGARVIGAELAKSLVDVWLRSEFQESRSGPKVERIREIEKSFIVTR